MMAAAVRVVGGVDPHADTIHVAVLTAVGKRVADAEYPATAPGYAAAIRFLSAQGLLERVGVEGAASYGAGITRALTGAGIAVVEVERPTRSARRRAGKSDRLDAYHAARAVLAERTSPVKDPALDGLRALHLARRSAVKARTAAINQLKSILVMAPDPVRVRFAGLSGPRLVQAVLRGRGRQAADSVSADTMMAIKTLAERYRDLDRQARTLRARIDQLVSVANPGLRATVGVGPRVAAQLLITAGDNPDRLTSEASFAALCGAAPIPASSGKTRHMRLSRGGDRQANSALHRIALVRMSHHAPTRAFVQRQLDHGRSKKAILRILKRAIAREIYRTLTRRVEIPDYTDLRPARQAKHITLTAAAHHLGIWPATLSRLERGQQRHDQLAQHYRAWLSAA
jgi:transposase